MIVGDIEEELDAISSDIASLEAEIKQLQAEESLLLAELHTFELDTSNPNHTKQQNPYDSDIPAILRHHHFDASISQFFDQPSHSPAAATVMTSQSNKVPIDNMELKENILYENIVRMSGLTAFPLNNYVLGDSDHWLGLRFDIYSTATSMFTTPHYAILKKVKSENKLEQLVESWSLHRHTLPKFFPLADIQHHLTDLEHGPRRFALHIRRWLVRLQYKADKISKLTTFNLSHFGGKSTKPIVVKINKDLQCHRIRLHITNRMSLSNRTHVIDLVCSDEVVQFIHIELNDTEADANINSDISVCQSMVKDTRFEDLFKAFRRVFEYLIQKQLI